MIDGDHKTLLRGAVKVCLFASEILFAIMAGDAMVNGNAIYTAACVTGMMISMFGFFIFGVSE